MNADHIQRTAADWLAKRTGDAWSERDEAEFDAWIEADVSHRVQYLRIEAAWKQAARLKALGAGVASGTIPPPHSWGDKRYYRGNIEILDVVEPQSSASATTRDAPHAQRRLQSRRFLGIAASALLCIFVGTYAYINYFDANHYTTAIGATNTVPLKDGSHVTLNTDTSIHVDLGEKQRHIALDKGEAFFEVAHDANRPFVVAAADRRVIAVGTKFSVRVIPAKAGSAADIVVAVTEGKVRLENSNTDQAPEPSAASTFLAAGAVAHTVDSKVIVSRYGAADTERLLSWRTGYVTFDNTPLADAIAELNRYNARKISIEDPAIAAIRIGGSFRATNTDAFLDLLQSGHGIVIERGTDVITLRAR